MSKISKRESIIISIAAVTVLFGAYAFVSPAKTMPAAESIPVPQATDLLANMSKDPSSAVDAYIIGLAETDWRIDPFSGRHYKATGNKKAARGYRKTDLNYTGYLEMGNQKMAVINGNSYRNGDPLEAGGYTLLSIFPSRVVIEDRYTGVKFDVPLKEEKL